MFRKVLLGVLSGMVLGAIALTWADADLPTPDSANAPSTLTAKPFLGPSHANAAALETVGDDWLGVHSQAASPIKMGTATDPFEMGAGTSTARGGPGSPWGPLHQPTTTAKPAAGFTPDSRLFALTPTSPLAAVSDRRTRRSDNPGQSLDALIPSGPPREWRWDIGY